MPVRPTAEPAGPSRRLADGPRGTGVQVAMATPER